MQLSVAETTTSLNPTTTQQSFGRPRPSNHLSSRHSLGLRLHTEPAFIHEATAVPEPPPQQQSNDTNAPFHPSVLADRSVLLAEPAPASGSAEQAPVARTAPIQQPGSLEQTNPSLRRWPQTETHVFFHPGSSESSRPTELHNTTQQ